MDNRIISVTLKAAALVKLVDAGVIQREEDGSVNTEGFERFWSGFEQNLYTAMDITLAELSARYKNAENTLAKAKIERDCILTKKKRKKKEINPLALSIFSLIISLFFLFFVILLARS